MVKVFLEELLNGRLSDNEIASKLQDINKKGITPLMLHEGRALLMQYAVPFDTQGKKTVGAAGTGGTGLNLPNITTPAAFIAAGAGCNVVKHMNGGITSSRGSADFLSAYNIKINLKPEQMADIFSKTGLAFLYAPTYHQGVRHAQEARRSLKCPTIFNLLGPICNPADPESMVVGANTQFNADLIGESLNYGDPTRAIVFNSGDKVDEVTPFEQTTFLEIGGETTRDARALTSLSGEAQELSRLSLTGSINAFNKITSQDPKLSYLEVAYRETLLQNAAVIICADGKADSLRAGYNKAESALEEGAVFQKVYDYLRAQCSHR